MTERVDESASYLMQKLRKEHPNVSDKDFKLAFKLAQALFGMFDDSRPITETVEVTYRGNHAGQTQWQLDIKDEVSLQPSEIAYAIEQYLKQRD